MDYKRISLFISSLVRLPLPKQLLTSQTTLEDFESLTGWASDGVISNDTTHVKSGSQGINFKAATAGATPVMNKDTSMSLSSRTNQMIWIYTADPTKFSSVVIYLTSTNYSTYLSISLAGNQMSVGWNAIDLSQSKWSSYGGAAWSETFTKVRFRLNSVAGQVGDITLDGWIGYVSTPAISISFDDNRISLLSTAFPYLRGKKVRASVYCVTDWVGNDEIYLNWTQLQEMSRGNYGWDICNHSKTHPHLTALSQADQQTELRLASEALVANGFTNTSKYVAYPFSERDATADAAMAAEGMLTGRTGTQANNFMPIMKPYVIYSLDAGTKTVAQLKTIIDNTISNKWLTNLYFHNLVDEISTPNCDYLTSDFIEIIDYALSKNLPFLTASDIHNLVTESISIIK